MGTGEGICGWEISTLDKLQELWAAISAATHINEDPPPPRFKFFGGRFDQKTWGVSNVITSNRVFELHITGRRSDSRRAELHEITYDDAKKSWLVEFRLLESQGVKNVY